MRSRGGRPTQGTTKLELAKMASFSAITLLNPFDQVGLVAFNTDTEWVIPLTEAGDRERIGAKLSGLNHSGGTDVYKGLVEGFQALSQVKAIKKHLILLSDGLTPKADFEGIGSADGAAAHHRLHRGVGRRCRQVADVAGRRLGAGALLLCQ